MNENIVKLSSPATLPTGVANAIAFSPDNKFVVVGHNTTPFITIYKRVGDALEKIPNPSSLPTGNVNFIAFSDDSQYMAVTTGSTSPYIEVYKIVGETFTKLSALPALGMTATNECSFSGDGTYLAVAGNVSPFIVIYKRNADTFTKLPNVSTLPPSGITSTSFSQDGVLLAIAHGLTFSVYRRSGDTFTKLNTPTVAGMSTINEVRISRDGNYLGISHAGVPYFSVLKINGDNFNLLPTPSYIPSNNAMTISFSANSKYVHVGGYGNTERLFYKIENDTLLKVENMATGASGGTGSAFSYDNLYFANSISGTPYIEIYKGDFRGYLNKILISLSDGEVCSSEIADPNVNVIPAMTSNTAPSGIASASSLYMATYDAYIAFDGVSNSGGWLTNSTLTGWLAYEFPTPKVIIKYTIIPYSAAKSPKNWTFEGSNDGGTTWVTLDTQTNISSWAANVKKVFSISNNVSYKKYRINITGSNDTTNVGICELEMMESYANYVSFGVKTPNENDYINRGLNKSAVVDLSKTLSTRVLVEVNTTTLGSGKVFKRTIDTSLIAIKKATIQ